jgi:hypothetical protein
LIELAESSQPVISIWQGLFDSHKIDGDNDRSSKFQYSPFFPFPRLSFPVLQLPSFIQDPNDHDFLSTTGRVRPVIF